MVADFPIALTLATYKRADVQGLFFRRGGLAPRDRVTATLNGRRQVHPITPDGSFGLQFANFPEGQNRAFFFLEAVRSTMTRERFLQKLLGYWEWFDQGGHTGKHGIRAFRVLTVTKSEERLEVLVGVAGGTEGVQ